MATQVSIPKGTRDFGPNEMAKRNYIFDTIKSVFNKYGYAPIETPAMETLSTLMGKYGDEGDQLLFKILNSGNFLKKTRSEDFNPEKLGKLTSKISEKGLRYDLTVPFARFVVQHRNEISFPFKRYQIQPVWRGDRPAKGRYREFYQCDVDVIGSQSLLNEFELIQIIEDVFNLLDVNVTIKINNRKILAGIAEVIGAEDKFIDITVAIDKIDKIGLEEVVKELLKKEISEESIEKLKPVLAVKRNTKESITFLEKMLQSSETGMKGIEEVKAVFKYISLSEKTRAEIELDLSLARGLNYYTGAIFEVKSNDVEIGSICGGGRYDNLTEVFGLKDISGVGISFGADRIYDVMTQLNNFPKKANITTDLLFVNFGVNEEIKCLELAKNIRKAGFSCEVYPQKAKLDKQFKYANNKNIPFVVIIGEDEITKSVCKIKNMTSGEQSEVEFNELVDFLKK